MIQPFVDRFMAAKPQMLADLEAQKPDGYDDLVSRVVKVVAGDEYATPDANRITIIDHGDYQGTKLYIVGSTGYQPSTYWSIFVGYGSCSVCDSFEAIGDYVGERPTAEQANEYWTLMLHMVQGMALVGGKE